MRQAIVTGCSGQLGRCLTAELQREGWRVIGLDITPPTGLAENATFEFNLVDITDQLAVLDFFKELDGRGIKVDGLVNNVGTAVFTPFEERTSDEINFVTATNIHAPIYMSQGFLSVAVSGYKASIVNIASIYGLVAPDQSLYSDTPRNSAEIYGMTKAATVSLTQYLSVYLKDYGIRCNCVSPGGVLLSQGPEFIRNYAAKVPMNRMAAEEEIVAGICYLLDVDRSSYVNGANLVIDGGFTAWR